MDCLRLTVCAGVLLSALAGVAQAADLRPLVTKAPAPMRDPWVGPYMGLNVGYSWGEADVATAVAPIGSASLPFTATFPGSGYSTALKPSGMIAGGQIGFTMRVARGWLAGVEADLQWSGQRDSGRSTFIFPVDCDSNDCTGFDSNNIDVKLRWFGTVRGRFGGDWNGYWLYATGGLAVGEVSVSGVHNLTIIDNVFNSVASFTTPYSYSKTALGWTLGAGIEAAIGASNWTWKIEYLYIDLGTVGAARLGTAPLTLDIDANRFIDQIVRFGINYRFSSL